MLKLVELALLAVSLVIVFGLIVTSPRRDAAPLTQEAPAPAVVEEESGRIGGDRTR